MTRKKINTLQKVPEKILSKSIYDLHGCESVWVESVPVKEVFEGETVWQGVVQVSDLQGHPKANRCYAWSYGLNKSKKRRFFAVLHEGVIDSPGSRSLYFLLEPVKE